MHAVLEVALAGLPPEETAETGVGVRDGFLTSGIGVMFFVLFVVVLLILVLRLVDLGFQY